ncbi:hypothetical protein U14_05504 [Candidatus Moduliflexus flocculans]|uniref:Uncharacterized protein n=1 Tax=Candidatus Moduliflexus flocculans TaxID=1499966 RepID=A0A081BS44_9BACT|nr:hypothetical protein U14_05504 [Candidatus Moduliflexus flocculans]
MVGFFDVDIRHRRQCDDEVDDAQPVGGGGNGDRPLVAEGVGGPGALPAGLILDHHTIALPLDDLGTLRDNPAPIVSFLPVVASADPVTAEEERVMVRIRLRRLRRHRLARERTVHREEVGVLLSRIELV